MTKQLTITITVTANEEDSFQSEFELALENISNSIVDGNTSSYFDRTAEYDFDANVETSYSFDTKTI